jgi:hypothetical protein
MIREETFMGELVETSSPQISEIEAIENASFGKYDYDPAARQASMIYPGQYGYSGSFNGYMNPPGYNGIGMSPPGFGFGNPLFQNPQYQYYQQQYQPPQEIKSFIPPVNFGGEYLPSLDWEEKVNGLIAKYSEMQEEEFVERVMNGQKGYGYGNNYYGTPYFSPYGNFSPLSREISQVVEEMKAEARESRIEFNKMLSRAAHSYLNEEISEEELDERYRGKYIDTPGYKGITYQEVAEQNQLDRLVPFDNSSIYRNHNAKVSQEFHQIIPEESNLVDTFVNTGVLMAKYDMDEEEHRRRNAAGLYDSSTGAYKYFVRAKAAERYAKKNGISNPLTGQNYGPTAPPVDAFPTLRESAKLCDDGTLNITCNFGSHKGEIYSVNNAMEEEYERDRDRFVKFYQSIPGSTFLNNPNEIIVEDGGSSD